MDYIEKVWGYKSEKVLNIKYIPHATTWLNGERWKDDLSSIQETPTTGSITLPDSSEI